MFGDALRSLLPGWLADILLTPEVVAALVYPGLVTALIAIILLIWLERKIAAKVQLRYGPLYVTRRLGGVLQLVADLIKFTFNEPLFPRDADRLFFAAAPIVALAFSILPIVAVPASPRLVAAKGPLSLLIAVALLTVAPIFIMVAGWASNNKFSLVGAAREGFLVLSYEIPLFISVLSVAAMYGTLDLVEIVRSQKDVWAVFLNPVAAVVFFVTILMSTGKFPFEIAEAESEIVVGPFTEYNSILFGLTMGTSYLKVYVMSWLFADLFLGGWYGPFWRILPPGAWGLVKASAVMVLAVFMRAAYPRLRIDQALDVGWSQLIPLSLISLLIGIAVGVVM